MAYAPLPRSLVEAGGRSSNRGFRPVSRARWVARNLVSGRDQRVLAGASAI